MFSAFRPTSIPVTPMLQTPVQQAQEQASEISRVLARLWSSITAGGSLEKLIIFVLTAVALYALARVIRRGLHYQIEDVKRRHELRKVVNYGFWIALTVTAVTLFAEQLDLQDLGTVLGLIAAAITIALADVIRSLAGWIYVISRRGVEVGSRVEVEEIKGDVIDIGLLKTTLLEVGEPLVHGLQSTGRLVTVPNSVFLGKNVFSSASENPLVWQELQIQVTFESDWKRAREILNEIAHDLYQEIVPDLKVSFANLERRYAFRLGSTAPIVYTTIADSGVMLTLRFLTFVRRRRSATDRIATAVLDRFAQEPAVELAYPTYRMYRAGEEHDRQDEDATVPPVGQ